MDETPQKQSSFWNGLGKILHLKPNEPENQAKKPSPFENPTLALEKTPRVPALTKKEPPFSSTGFTPPAKPTPLPSNVSTKKSIVSPIPEMPPRPIVQKTYEQIVTDYDKIYELVKNRQAIKLDEIARLLGMKEEKIAQELQTLEDNGLVEVKYPAFGEPLICYKKQEG